MKQPKIKGSFIRTCAGCGSQFDKRTLLRVAKGADGVYYDTCGKGEGRGAYVCKSKSCLAKVEKSRRLSRLLGAEVGQKIFEELEATLGEE